MDINLTNKNGIQLNTAEKYCTENIKIIPVLQEKEVKVNGTIEPDTNYAGLSKVVVDVPSVDNPIEITDVTIPPDSDNLGKFAVDTTTNKMYKIVNADSNKLFEFSQGLPNDTRFSSIAYGKNAFVAVGDGDAYYKAYIYYSNNGKVWTKAFELTTSASFISIVYGGDRFIVVGRSESYYSLDGIVWTNMTGLPIDSTIQYAYQQVAYGNGRFVCVRGSSYYNGSSVTSYGGAWYSTDGTSWTAMTGLPTNIAVTGVVFGGDRFVCCIEKLTAGSGIYYSVNGTSWLTTTGSDGEAANGFFNILYGNGKFVCLGRNKSYYSTNGASWTETTEKTEYLHAFVYNNVFYAGYNGVSSFSTDGISWQNLPTTNPLRAFNCIAVASSSEYSVFLTYTVGKTYRTWVVDYLEVVDASLVKEQQEKSVTITENKTTEVLPDENKVLSKVTITTNIQPALQQKTATANGQVSPDADYYGLSKVFVAIPVYNGEVE